MRLAQVSFRGHDPPSIAAATRTSSASVSSVGFGARPPPLGPLLPALTLMGSMCLLLSWGAQGVLASLVALLPPRAILLIGHPSVPAFLPPRQQLRTITTTTFRGLFQREFPRSSLAGVIVPPLPHVMGGLMMLLLLLPHLPHVMGGLIMLLFLLRMGDIVMPLQTWFDPGWITLGQMLVFLVLNVR
jgi:hypothetical protein